MDDRKLEVYILKMCPAAPGDRETHMMVDVFYCLHEDEERNNGFDIRVWVEPENRTIDEITADAIQQADALLSAVSFSRFGKVPE